MNSIHADTTIAKGVAYQLPDFMRRTGLARRAVAIAERKGLTIHTSGQRRFVIGDSWIAYLEQQAKNEVNTSPQ